MLKYKKFMGVGCLVVMMISPRNSEKIITEFQEKIDSLNTVKQITFLEKKELVLKDNDTLKRPSYHL